MRCSEAESLKKVFLVYITAWYPQAKEDEVQDGEDDEEFEALEDLLMDLS